MNIEKTESFINNFWDKEIVPNLSEFIKIPCKSPAYDVDWQNNKYLEKAAALVGDWIKKQNIAKASVEVVKEPNRVPLLFVDIPANTANNTKTAIFYGHLDKMPEAGEWGVGFGPWQPVLKNNRLYGRGVADNGYSGFAAIAAIKAIIEQSLEHGRVLFLLECGEECGSEDFPFYLEQLKNKIGTPDLVIVLDTGAENHEQLWCRSSLRGLAGGVLRVEVLKTEMHSGVATGIVPSSFRIMRQLLSRIEDEKTGKILLQSCNADVPKERINEAKETASVLGKKIYESVPFVQGCQPVLSDMSELLINQTWMPGMGTLGANGFPKIETAGNVLRPFTELKISLRLPPTCDAVKVINELKEVLEKDPPYNAKVIFTPMQIMTGWNSPVMSDVIKKSLNVASESYIGKQVKYLGCGGGIGVVKMMADTYPNAKFIVTGAEDINSNSHGVDESLDIEFAKKVTCCIAHVLADYFKK